LKAYGSIPWLHAVVRRRAEALASVEWVVYRAKRGSARALPGMRAGYGVRHEALARHLDSGALELVPEHELLALLDDPTPAMNGPARWELLSKHADLLGEAIDGISLSGGKPSALTPIVPTWVKETPTPERQTFVVEPPGGARTEKSAKRVLWVRQHDPLDPYAGRGVGTSRALADELETDEYAATTAKARFYNRAAPELIVALEGVSAEALKGFSTEFEDRHRGPARHGRTHFVNQKFQAQHLSHTMVESQYVDVRRLGRDSVMQVFGVPPELLGVLENANRSTIDAAEVLFARYSTVPMAERFRAEKQRRLVPYYGRDLVLDYLSPVPADAEAERKVMVALPGAFTVNEIRQRGGAQPREDGDEYYQAPGAPSIPLPDQPEAAEPADDDRDAPRLTVAGV